MQAAADQLAGSTISGCTPSFRPLVSQLSRQLRQLHFNISLP
jgi:hypothetical protein